jgi:hypothetical protein
MTSILTRHFFYLHAGPVESSITDDKVAGLTKDHDLSRVPKKTVLLAGTTEGVEEPAVLVKNLEVKIRKLQRESFLSRLGQLIE